MKPRVILFVTLAVALAASGCGRASADYDPKAIEAAYGLSGAYVDKISTQDGEVDATIVPTTLEDGRKVQLVIPHRQFDPAHRVYMREGVTITPVALADPSVQRADFVQSRPSVVERRVVESQPAPSIKKKRSTKDEILIIGGSAGAGTAIGALAGGKKGAAVGAVSGGVAGLVYDLATRNKK
jgi:hypothetical protein